MELKSNHEHKYKLLKDEARSDDSSENKTHENIADNLYKLITDAENDSDFNIGLEGSWGSGKSTIISILKNKFQNQQKIFYFYFDAWQHEGDPLRRIFLEELVRQLKEKVSKRSTEEEKKLEELSKKISNRQKTVNTKTTQSATGLGKLLTIAAFLVPLGAAVLSSVKLDEIEFAIYLKHYWFLVVSVFGFICCIAPLIVILGNLLKLGWLKISGKIKKITDSQHWSFLEKESNAESTQEISESEERSSIEFAKYFEEILDALKKNEYKKVLFIIDNLDRVDPHDSLKIWSTLQTFFQNRNPSNEDKSDEVQKYFIVPFDREGLRKLWDKEKSSQANTETKKDETKDETVAQSFFNKCFQLIISVPPLTHNAWEAFLKDKLKESLKHIETVPLTTVQENFIKEVITVFKSTRENAVDIPSYREIINFINQVNWLKASVNEEISNKAIAYFAIYKYIKFKSIDEIIKLILSDEDRTFNLEEKKEIAGIIYGVSPEKGLEILLGKEIAKYWGEDLNDFRKQFIIKLETNFQNAFWTQLGVFFRNKKYLFSDFLKLAYMIYKTETLERSSHIQVWLFIEMKKRWIEKDSTGLQILENESVLDMYKNLFQVSSQQEDLIKYFYKVLTNPIRYGLLTTESKSLSFGFFIKLFNEIYSISNKQLFSLKPQVLILKNDASKDPNSIVISWLNFTKEVFINNSETEIYKYLLPPASLIASLSENGYYNTFETQYLPDLHYLLKYAFKSGKFQQNIGKDYWIKLIKILTNYVQHYHSTDNNQNAESFYLALIELMKLGYDLTDFLTNNNIYFPNYVNHNKNLLKYPALLYLSINLPSDQTIRNTVPALRSFWEQDIRENKNLDLEFIFNNLEYIQNNSALWNLLQEDISSHKAVVAVISMVINASNGKMHDNILNDLKNQLKNLTLESWTEVFNKLLEDGLAGCPIIEIALSLSEKDSTFTLTEDYKNALLNFVERLLKTPATSWINPIQRYQKLIYILDNEYQTEFRKATIPNILDNWNHLQSNVLDLFGDFIDFNELATNEVFKNHFKELLRDDSINPQQINKFCTVYQRIYKPSRDSELEKLIKLRIEKIDNPQDKLRLSLRRISQKLGIDLEGKET
jgi:hypothetical protein